jgi:hypothetical protein
MVGPTDEERARGDFEITVTCIFCGEGVAEDATDSCQVTVAASGGTVMVWCHAGCFRAAAHEPEHFPDLGGEQAIEPQGVEPADEKLAEAREVFEGVLTELEFAEMTDADSVWSLAQDLVEVARPRR